MKTYRIEYGNGGVIAEKVEGKDLFEKIPPGPKLSDKKSKNIKNKNHALYETPFGAKIIVYEN